MVDPSRRRVRTRTQPEQAVAPETSGVPPELTIIYGPITGLTNPKVVRAKSKTFGGNAAEGMLRHGVDIPIVALRSGEVVFGGEFLEVYRLLGRETVPIVYLEDRSRAATLALRHWYERLFADGEWDFEVAKADFEEIFKLDPSWITATGWTMSDVDFALHTGLGEIEQALVGSNGSNEASDVVTRAGDLWVWKTRHRLLCGSARERADVQRLMNGLIAALLVADPPYGISVKQISGHHKPFLEGDGMSPKEALSFHGDYLTLATEVVRDGAWVYLFIDGKGMHPLLSAVLEAGLTQKSLICWDKAAAGQGGSLYRNQAEFVVLAKHGQGKSIDNVNQGAHRRRRTTVWSAPGYAQFRPDRKEALKNHSCTKPQALLIDILLDASNVGDVAYDPFCGSGSTILAAERSRRIVYGMEICGEYCDTAVRRMFELTGEYPVLEGSGQRFDEVALERGIAWPAEALEAAQAEGGVDA